MDSEAESISEKPWGEHAQVGDTWWFDGDCPECGHVVHNNGSVRVCPDCEWWETDGGGSE